jgi:hypothetical protein
MIPIVLIFSAPCFRSLQAQLLRLKVRTDWCTGPMREGNNFAVLTLLLKVAGYRR